MISITKTYATFEFDCVTTVILPALCDPPICSHGARVQKARVFDGSLGASWIFGALEENTEVSKHSRLSSIILDQLS